MIEEKEKIANLGRPSLIFGSGQERRLNLIKKYLNLENKKILDVGCGVGVYAKKFAQTSKEVYGTDIDEASIKEAKKNYPDIKFFAAPAEKLPFPDNLFDIVFLHEVLEHVVDDKKAVQEAYRVLKPGAKIVIFVPNRLYFFETHGIYLAKKYIYRNIPLINWLPRRIRNFFCPHVRIYTVSDLKGLFKGLKVDFEVIDYIYPALDKLSRRHQKIGRTLRRLFDFAEKNWLLRHFGISIFAIVKKTD